MHSHHSHSGDYVAHGVDPLDAMVAQARKMNFVTYCLTEHMPRIDPNYIYPEEREIGGGDDDQVLETLSSNFEKFLKHAQKIKNDSIEGETEIIIGTEIEGCDVSHINYAKKLLEEKKDVIKFCVGSVHHIYGIPIDFDQENWNTALKKAGNNLKQLIIDYFELQYKQLTS